MILTSLVILVFSGLITTQNFVDGQSFNKKFCISKIPPTESPIVKNKMRKDCEDQESRFSYNEHMKENQNSKKTEKSKLNIIESVKPNVDTNPNKKSNFETKITVTINPKSLKDFQIPSADEKILLEKYRVLNSGTDVIVLVEFDKNPDYNRVKLTIKGEFKNSVQDRMELRQDVPKSGWTVFKINSDVFIPKQEYSFTASIDYPGVEYMDKKFSSSVKAIPVSNNQKYPEWISKSSTNQSKSTDDTNKIPNLNIPNDSTLLEKFSDDRVSFVAYFQQEQNYYVLNIDGKYSKSFLADKSYIDGKRFVLIIPLKIKKGNQNIDFGMTKNSDGSFKFSQKFDNDFKKRFASNPNDQFEVIIWPHIGDKWEKRLKPFTV